MFVHIFKNRFKVLLRNKSMIFWSLIFPLVLATFFNLAFSNLTSEETFEAFDIAVVENTNFYNDENFKIMLDSISKEDENKVVNITYVSEENEAIRLLEDNDIKGYFIVNDAIDIVVKENGVEQTIMKYVVDNYYQTYSVIGHLATTNPEAIGNELIEQLNSEDSYFKDISSQNVDSTVIYFYTLIGMVCMYGGFFGMNATNETEVNLSKRAARLSVSPVHKLKVLLISLLVGLIIQFINNLILLAYLVLVLGVNFGNQLGYIILLILVGTFAGITFGVVVGSSNRKSENIKTAIVSMGSLVLSFLAGMMIWTMKYIIEENIPILNRINPVSMITDALYSLYYYNTLDRYYFNIISLVIFSIAMIIISYMFIRRKKYDSI